MSVEETVKQIEDSIQSLNYWTAMEVVKDPELKNNPMKLQTDYTKKRKETAEEIYRILLTAFEFIEDHAERTEQENDKLRVELDSMAAVANVAFVVIFITLGIFRGD